jgi:hypothetical protein
MICLIALVVFGIMSIFSVGFRPLAKESFNCVFRRLTLGNVIPALTRK